ncbi:MAG: SoxR reducing system RseC family protein [Gammaproteobacteria bacterium]|nr:SoxR reducing system RseC family protein [Gammaproteobacteria bacterium]
MITTTARVVFSNAQTTLVEFEPAGCASCVKGCSQKSYFQDRAEIEIPGEYHAAVELSLTLPDHLVLLLHSLLLPLMGFVLGGVIVNGMQMGEGLVIVGSVAGLLSGIMACKVQTFERLKLIEVERHE